MAKHIVLGNLDGAKDPQAYVTHKLQGFGQPDNDQAPIAQKIVGSHTSVTLSLVSDRSIDDLENQAQVRELAKCFSGLVNGWFELAPNEELIEESFSCLDIPFEAYPAGSPVIMKKTNFGTTYYIDTNFKVSGNKLVAQPQYVRSLVLDDKERTKSESIMVDLASELADAALGDLGSTILGLVIGDDGEPSLKELEDGFTNIIKRELISFDVTNENAKLQTQYQNVNQSYNIKKKEGADKATLFHDAEDIEEKIRGSVNNLGSKPYVEAGLPGYIAGRNLQFCMLQEKCIQDTLVTSPFQSRFAGVLSDNIEAAITHVQSAYDSALKNRFDFIWTGQKNIPTIHGIDTQWQVIDNFKNKLVFHTGYGGSKKEKEKEKRDARIAREAYEDTIRKSLKWMQDVKARWQELLKHPLGK